MYVVVQARLGVIWGAVQYCQHAACLGLASQAAAPQVVPHTQPVQPQLHLVLRLGKGKGKGKKGNGKCKRNRPIPR